MICRNCNNQNPENARFCMTCGAPTAAAEPLPQAPADTSPVWLTQKPGEPSIKPKQPEDAPWLQQPSDLSAEPPPEPEWEKPTERTTAIPAAGKPPRKPRNRKKLILSMLAAVTALALLGGLLTVLLVFNAPQYKLAKAAENTLEQLREAVGDSESFVTILDTLTQIEDEEEFTLKFRYNDCYSGDSYYSDETVEGTLHYSFADEALSGTAAYRCDSEDLSESVELAVYADRDEAQLCVPSCGDAVYVLPLAGLGEQLQEAPLFDDISDEMSRREARALEGLDINLFPDLSLSAFKDGNGDIYDDFLNGGLKKSDEEIPDAEEDMTVYEFAPEVSCAAEFIGCYSSFVLKQCLGEMFVEELDADLENAFELPENTDDVDIRVYFGVRDGCLAAAALCAEYRGIENSMVLELLGEENLFDEFRITVYADGQTQGEVKGGLKATSNGFEMKADNGYNGYTLSFNDRRGAVTLVDGDWSQELFRCGSSDEGFWLACDNDGYYSTESVHIELLTLQEAPGELDGETVAISELNMDGLEEIFTDLERGTVKRK